MMKIFGVGNILMCDDGIGVRVAQGLKKSIENIDNRIKVIIGETDYMYCISEINKEDLVIIIDGTYFNIEPGEITVLPLDIFHEKLRISKFQHEESLVKVLTREFGEIRGWIIGIEIESIDYSLDLSPTLKKDFDYICEKVFIEIKKLLEGNLYA